MASCTAACGGATGFAAALGRVAGVDAAAGEGAASVAGMAADDGDVAVSAAASSDAAFLGAARAALAAGLAGDAAAGFVALDLDGLAGVSMPSSPGTAVEAGAADWRWDGVCWSVMAAPVMSDHLWRREHMLPAGAASGVVLDEWAAAWSGVAADRCH